MSSTQRFLRQRVVSNTLLSASALTAPNTQLYVMIAGASNYLGNYPNGVGWMVTASAAGAALPLLPAGAVLRDMGKTVYAGVSTSLTAASSTAKPGFFRVVQLLAPSTVASATASTSFGVGIGAAGAGTLPKALPSGNAGDDGYGTFYLPIVVDGVIASDATGTALTPLAVTPLLGNQL